MYLGHETTALRNWFQPSRPQTAIAMRGFANSAKSATSFQPSRPQTAIAISGRPRALVAETEVSTLATADSDRDVVAAVRSRAEVRVSTLATADSDRDQPLDWV